MAPLLLYLQLSLWPKTLILKLLFNSFHFLFLYSARLLAGLFWGRVVGCQKCFEESDIWLPYCHRNMICEMRMSHWIRPWNHVSGPYQEKIDSDINLQKTRRGFSTFSAKSDKSLVGRYLSQFVVANKNSTFKLCITIEHLQQGETEVAQKCSNKVPCSTLLHCVLRFLLSEKVLRLAYIYHRWLHFWAFLFFTVANLCWFVVSQATTQMGLDPLAQRHGRLNWKSHGTSTKWITLQSLEDVWAGYTLEKYKSMMQKSVTCQPIHRGRL